MEISDEKLDQLKEFTRGEYDKVDSIHCPLFNAKIFFSSEGFKHLIYKGKDNLKKRPRNEQYIRLKLFKLACKLLQRTKTFQDYFATQHWIHQRTNGRRDKVLKNVEYWGILAIIDGRRIKVVIRQYTNGDKKFWGVCPKWHTKKNPQTSAEEIINYSGDLEGE